MDQTAEFATSYPSNVTIPKANLKHSGFGIASFITATISGILIFGLIIIAGAIEAGTPGGMDEESVGAVIVGLLLLGFTFLSVIALGLGVAGFFQKDRKRIFAILGSLFSGLVLTGTIFIIILGLAIG